MLLKAKLRPLGSCIGKRRFKGDIVEPMDKEYVEMRHDEN